MNRFQTLRPSSLSLSRSRGETLHRSLSSSTLIIQFRPKGIIALKGRAAGD